MQETMLHVYTRVIDWLQYADLDEDRAQETLTLIRFFREQNNDLRSNVSELEKAAESWMKDYDALKNKYEPTVVTQG